MYLRSGSFVIFAKRLYLFLIAGGCCDTRLNVAVKSSMFVLPTTKVSDQYGWIGDFTLGDQLTYDIPLHVKWQSMMYCCCCCQATEYSTIREPSHPGIFHGQATEYITIREPSHPGIPLLVLRSQDVLRAHPLTAHSTRLNKQVVRNVCRNTG